LDGKIFQAALEETATQLNVKRENLNQINVFPVPDGDTGNNLLATLESALQETENSNSTNLAEVAAAAFRGARNGSCGNSGAIFAQYLKGWAAAFSGLEKAGARQLALAMAQGAKKTYNTVVNPIEGTILTVAREAAEAAVEESATGNLAKTMLAAYRQARKSLLQTSRAMFAMAGAEMAISVNAVKKKNTPSRGI
jgi:dihydroxyacetone kinase-like predicted kinase